MFQSCHSFLLQYEGFSDVHFLYYTGLIIRYIHIGTRKEYTYEGSEHVMVSVVVHL